MKTGTPAADGLVDTHLSEPGRQRLDVHLEAVMKWLCAAQDRHADPGVASTYTLFKGWSASYPETTGYIIPTFLDYGRHTGRAEFDERALRMADWLVSLQRPDGSFDGGPIGGERWASVFDTGQILFGLLGAHEATDTAAYLDAGWSAGRWLVTTQDADGGWPGSVDYLGQRHAYNARVAWPLILLARVSGETRFSEAAARHVAWVLDQAHPDGFVDLTAFDPDGSRGLLHDVGIVVRHRTAPSFFTTASLHTLAYTIEGLLESAWLLGDSAPLDCAKRGATTLAEHILADRLAGFYGSGWAPLCRSQCLTGVAQMASVWLRLHEMGEGDFLAAADRAIALLLDAQRMERRPRQLHGAVAGSSPLHGRYLPFRFPNWAAKFTADVYLARLRLAGASLQLVNRLDSSARGVSEAKRSPESSR